MISTGGGGICKGNSSMKQVAITHSDEFREDEYMHTSQESDCATAQRRKEIGALLTSDADVPLRGSSFLP